MFDSWFFDHNIKTPIIKDKIGNLKIKTQASPPSTPQRGANSSPSSSMTAPTSSSSTFVSLSSPSIRKETKDEELRVHTNLDPPSMNELFVGYRRFKDLKEKIAIGEVCFQLDHVVSNLLGAEVTLHDCNIAWNENSLQFSPLLQSQLKAIFDTVTPEMWVSYHQCKKQRLPIAHLLDYEKNSIPLLKLRDYVKTVFKAKSDGLNGAADELINTTNIYDKQKKMEVLCGELRIGADKLIYLLRSLVDTDNVLTTNAELWKQTFTIPPSFYSPPDNIAI